MNKTRLVLMLWALAIVAGCGSGTRGSGTVTSDSRKVSDFTGVELNGSGKLIIEQSDIESLSITSDDNLLPLLTSEVQGSTLKLGTKDFMSVKPTNGITYKLLVKKLNSIGVSGGAEIDAKGLLTDSLSIAVSGAGDIRITGETKDLKIAISGAGNFDGEGFKSKDASVSISGVASAKVAVSDLLDVHVSGAGDVEYIGDPKVTQEISGAGSVKKKS